GDVDLARSGPASEREAEGALERLAVAADRAEHVRGLARERVARRAGRGGDASEIQLEQDAVRLHAGHHEGRVVRQSATPARASEARLREPLEHPGDQPVAQLGSRVPISPFDAMSETTAVSSRIHRATASGSARPSASTGT